ncbi:hypothetical protein MRY87_09125, partial [bacterium]|nr:hypothetical protein [bacterium]
MVFIRFSLVTFLSLLLTVGTAQALQVECSGGQLDLKVEGLGSLVSIDRNELSSRRGRRSAVKTLSKYMLRNSRRALQTRRAFRKAKRKMRKKLNRVVKRCMRREGTFGLRPDRLGLRANSSCSAEAPSIVRYTELLDQSQTDGFTFKATIGNFGSKPAFPGAPGIYALIRGSGSTPFPLTHMEYAHTPVNEGEEITAQIGALGNAVEAEVIIAQFCDNEVFYSAPLAVTAQPDKALNPADFAHFPRAAVLRTEISTFTPRTTIEGTIPVDASLAAELDSGAKTFVARNATSGEVFPVDYEPIAFQTAEDGSRLPSIYQLALATHGFPGIEAFEILPVPNSLVERHRTPFQTTPHITDFLSNGRIRAVFEGPAANYRAQFDMSQCTERVFDGDRLQVYSCSKKVQTDDNRYPANMVVTIFVRVFSGLNFVSLEGVLANSNQLGVSNIIVNRGYLRANIGSRQLTFGIRSLQENGRELYRHGLSYDGTRYDLIKQISAAQNHVIPQDHLMPWDGVAIHLNEESRELADAYLENYRPAVAGCEAQSLESLGQNFLLQRPLGMAVVGDPQTFFSQPELQAIANDVFNIHAPITDVYESSNPKMVYSVHPEFYTYFTGYRQLSGGSGNGLELTSPLLTLACGLRSEGLGRVLDAASFRLKAFQSRLVTSAAYYGSEKNTLPNFESHATQNWNFGGLFRFHIPFERASEYNPNDQLIDDYPAL